MQSMTDSRGEMVTCGWHSCPPIFAGPLIEGSSRVSHQVTDMNKSQGAAAPFALFVGVFLIVEGIWGMMSPVVFGVLTTNKLHATIHIVLGLLGIYTAMTNGARAWCMFVGILIIVVGVLRFVPGVGDILVSLLNVNEAVAIFNIVAGAAALLVARMSPAQRRA